MLLNFNYLRFIKPPTKGGRSDGDLDIVIGSGGTLRYLLNDGLGVFSASSYLAAPPTVVFNIKFQDIDNDGLRDMFVNNHFYKNIGGPISSFSYKGGVSSDSRISIADVNNDGVADLVGGFATFLAIPTSISGLSELSVLQGSDSEAALRIIDGALANLESNLSKLTAEQQRRLHEIDSHFLTKESLEAAKESIGEADYALEIANVLEQQIKQQAQLAVLAQANTQRQIVLSLLSNLR